MANEKLTSQDSQYVLVSLPPDVCLTPMGPNMVPVPYPVTHKMDQSKHCSKSVFVEGEAVYLHGLSYVDNVQGDEAGTGGGVVTKVNTKVSHSLQKSATVYVNGHPVVRTGDRVQMNTRKP